MKDSSTSNFITYSGLLVMLVVLIVSVLSSVAIVKSPTGLGTAPSSVSSITINNPHLPPIQSPAPILKTGAGSAASNAQSASTAAASASDSESGGQGGAGTGVSNAQNDQTAIDTVTYHEQRAIAPQLPVSGKSVFFMITKDNAPTIIAAAITAIAAILSLILFYKRRKKKKKKSR